MTELPIYVGWDSREPEAYDVCRRVLPDLETELCCQRPQGSPGAFVG